MILEWLHLALRWFHVFAGILWIGATWFFTWLDGRLEDREENPDGVWMVHSGGFYTVRKTGVPEVLPSALHWFKWEAALTWLSGFALLVLVYWTGGLMIEYGSPMSPRVALASAIALLPIAWIIYDLLWISPLASRPLAATTISYLLIVAVAWGLTHLMSPRAAYMHVGAMLGTLMAANVWMRILPAQRAMIAAVKSGTQPDVTLGSRAKARSKHNTYMVMPAVFIMISSHFPTSTYGHRYSWLVLAILVLAGWAAARIVRGR